MVSLLQLCGFSVNMEKKFNSKFMFFSVDFANGF